MDYQAIFYILCALCVITVFIIFYYSFKINSTKNKIKKETEEAAAALAKNFKNLREEMQKQAAELEKKDIMSLEENINYKKIKEALDYSENYINKEIKDIIKALK